MVAIVFCGSRPWWSDYERATRHALAIAKPTSEGLLTTPEHDQLDHEGQFSCEQTKNKQETEIAIWILRIKEESFINEGGFCDAFVWSLNTNKVREVAAMANF